MSRRIKKVAVLGSGVMGSGIACHFANIGLQVLLLDIVPRDLSEADQKNPAARNAIVNKALAAAIKSKPAALYDKSFASRITTGNFSDDFGKISDCDWTIEVVIERLDIKKQIFENHGLIVNNPSGKYFSESQAPIQKQTERGNTDEETRVSTSFQSQSCSRKEPR